MGRASCSAWQRRIPARSSSEPAQQRVELGGDRALDSVQRYRGVDDFDALGMSCRPIEVTPSHALEERLLLPLEVIEPPRRDSPAADVERRVEQKSEVGLEAALHLRFERLEQPGAAPRPLP